MGTIYTCDLCNNVIEKDNKMITAGFGNWFGNKLCHICGRPVLKFLIKNNLIDESGIERAKNMLKIKKPPAKPVR